MKTFPWLVATVVGCASISLMAQQVNANGQQSTSVTAGGTQVSESSGVNAGGGMGRGGASANGALYAAAKMRPVNGELEGRLDSKTAKIGDPVIVKTTQKVMTAEGTEIPKGSRLVGHVTSAQAHAKGQAESQLSIAFDRAELRGGQSIAIHSMIESVSPPASAMALAETDDSADVVAGGGSASRMAGEVKSSAGGVLGSSRGVVGGAADGVGDAGSRVGSGLSAAADNSMDATGRVATNGVGMVGGTARGAAEATGSLAARATAIPGVMLSGDATGSASGTLTAAGRNVELQSGTQMVLGVAAEK